MWMSSGLRAEPKPSFPSVVQPEYAGHEVLYVRIVAMESPAMTNLDILGRLVLFVPEKQFLFFSPVSKAWRAAWGTRRTLTSAVSTDSSASQIRYSIECGLPRDSEVVCIALEQSGKPEALKCARESGLSWGVFTSVVAAAAGHLHALRWARQNGCRWGVYTCVAAAQEGHLPASSGHGRTAVPGATRFVTQPLGGDTSRSYSGRGRWLPVEQRNVSPGCDGGSRIDPPVGPAE